MLILVYLKVAAAMAALAAGREDIITVVVAIAVFIFFLGCMGRSLGMNVTFNVTVIFTALLAMFTLAFRGIRWLIRSIGRLIRGTFHGTENTVTRLGWPAGRARIAAILITGLMIAIII